MVTFKSYIKLFLLLLIIILKDAKTSALSNKIEYIMFLYKGDECSFTWRLFASWDFGIANLDAAHNKAASIVTGFR